MVLKSLQVSLLFIVWFLNICVNLSSKIELDVNNKLQNAVIHINDDVPEGDGSLLGNIQMYITAASRSLFTATSNMDVKKDGVQFGKVYIVLPKTWKATATEYITWQQCSKADFIISTDKGNSYKKDPFTKQIGECGQPGNYTRIPSSFFSSSDKTNVTVQGKRIMKEFVKLRYGVFSEEPYQNLLTVYNGSHFIPSTCGDQIKWKMSGSPARCSDLNNDCQYSINKNQNHNYSVMFDHETPSSEYFCDDKDRPHNVLAASIHNMKCNSSSISSIILSHPDFKNDRQKGSYSTPTIVLVKNQRRRIVFVLDLSGSMSGIIANMKLAVIEFVSKVVEDSADFGLAVFSSAGEIKSQLLPMDQASNRDTLVNIINTLYASGMTNIPDGLRKGIQILGGNVDDGQKLFGTIFLLTDGANNKETSIWDNMSLINKIIAKGLIVNTIVYGKTVDPKLDSLAKGSGGRFVYADPSVGYANLMSIFAYRSFCENPNNSSIKILEGKKEIPIISDGDIIDLFDGDIYMGKDMFLRLMFNTNMAKFNIKLLDPLGRIYNGTLLTQQTGVSTFTFKIPGNIELGKYRLRISSLSSKRVFKRSTTTIFTTFMVSVSLNKNSSRIINPTGHLSHNEIEEVNSLTKVLAFMDLSTCGIQKDEEVQISLTIENPNKVTWTREMRDDGIGCDSIGGDETFTTCIYSKDLPLREFYTFTGNVTIYSRDSQAPIQRTVDLGTLRVKNIAWTIPDRIPPARINSVNLTIVNQKKRILKIDFLATGEDGLIGNISLYNIKVGGVNKTIINVTHEAAPLQPVSLSVDLFKFISTGVFTVSIRGVDRAKNQGEWSPMKIFNWMYNEDRQRYLYLKSFNRQNCFIPWFVGACLTITWILF